MAKDDGAKQLKNRKRHSPAMTQQRNLRSCTTKVASSSAGEEAKASGSSEGLALIQVDQVAVEAVIVAASNAADTPATPAPIATATQEEPDEGGEEDALGDIWKEVTRSVCAEMDTDFSHGDGLPEITKAPPPEKITLPDDLDEGLRLLQAKNRAARDKVFKLKLTTYQLYSQLKTLEAANAAGVEELESSKTHARKLQQELNEAAEELKNAREEIAGLKEERALSIAAKPAEENEEAASKAEKLEKELDSLRAQIKEKNGIIALLRKSHREPRAALERYAAARQFVTP